MSQLGLDGFTGMKRWLQIIGAFYVLQFVAMAIVRAPIKTMGPADALSLAAAGDALARSDSRSAQSASGCCSRHAHPGRRAH